MPFKTFANNDILTAEEVNQYLMQQAVVRAASTAELNGLPAEVRLGTVGNNLYFRSAGDVWVRIYPQNTVPFVLRVRTTGQTFTAPTAAPVNYTLSQDIALGNIEIISATEVKIIESGIYAVKANMNVTGAVAGSNLELKIFINGIEEYGNVIQPGGSVSGLVINEEIPLNADDLISIYTNRSGTGTMTSLANVHRPKLVIRKVHNG